MDAYRSDLLRGCPERYGAPPPCPSAWLDDDTVQELAGETVVNALNWTAGRPACAASDARLAGDVQTGTTEGPPVIQDAAAIVVAPYAGRS